MMVHDQRALASDGAGRLEFAWLELTHACNLRCAQCYTHSTPETPHRSLPTERWLELLDEIVAAGGVAVQLTGGEATNHPDWREILAHATGRGLSVELFTNGFVLSEDDLDFLARHGTSLAISLHSHLPEVHDGITGVPGSFVATLESIRRACERGLHLRVATVLLEANADHGPKVEALVRRQGVLTPLSVDAVRPTGRGRSAVSPGDAPACTACRSSNYAAFHVAPDNLAQPTCWDGKIAIDPAGVVTPCIFSRGAPVGNVAELPLPRVLAEGPLAELWALSVDDVEACRGCDRKAECFDCRALPLSILGDPRAKNPRCDYQPPRAAPLPDEAAPLGLADGLESFACGEERLLLDRAGGRVHALNESAGQLLAALGGGERLQAIAARLHPSFGEDGPSLARLEADLGAARQALLEQGLLRPRPGEDAPVAQEGSWPRAAPPSTEPIPQSASGAGPSRVAEGAGERAGLLFGLPQLRGTVFVEASPEAAGLLRPWLEPVLLDEAETRSGEILGWIQVHSRRPDPEGPIRHYVLVDGVPEGDAISGAGLRSLLETAWCALAGTAPAGAPATLSFHAAGIRGEAGAVLVPGPSGTGKSLLCAHAVAAGADYLSDELVDWSLASGRVRGLPKPVTVKGEGEQLLPAALRLALTARDPLDPSEQRWLSLPAGRPGPLRAVVIPEREGAPGLRALPVVEGAAALLQSCFDLATLTRPEIEVLLAACQKTPFFALGTRDLPAAGATLASLVHRESAS